VSQLGVIVSFSYSSFIVQFPQFFNVDQDTAQAWFDVAGATCSRNDGGGPVSNAATQTVLMNFATAHLIQIFATQVNGQPSTESSSAVPAPTVVGRIQSATEGSVSVSAEYAQPPSGTAAWWLQTPYGAAWWQFTVPYRTMRYIVGPQRYFGPYGLANTPFWGGSAFVGVAGNVLF
jgi:hypothetical protein